MSHATDLSHLGHAHREHERLMDHWNANLNRPILSIQYEDLVRDQENITRRVVEFLGLTLDDRCLRYWESNRKAVTLNYDQVNKPIYDSSIGHWKNDERHLAPLLAALG